MGRLVNKAAFVCCIIVISILTGCTSSYSGIESRIKPEYRSDSLAKRLRSSVNTTDTNRRHVPAAVPNNSLGKVLYLQPLPGGGYVPIYPADNEEDVGFQSYPKYAPEDDNPSYVESPAGSGGRNGGGQYYYPLYFDE